MKKQFVRKTLTISVSIFVVIIGILSVHIYMVTRPKAPDKQTLVMARIDLKQPVTEAEGDSITDWLYHQHGVDHVLCNRKSSIVVFTYYPVTTNANDIAAHLKTRFALPGAQRYLPSNAELKAGCPVSATSFSYRAYSLISNIF